MTALAVFSEQDITPTFLDVFRAAKAKVLGDEPLDVSFIETLDEAGDAPVLQLGSSKTFKGAHVKTYSPKQLVTRGSALTDLVQALTLVLNLPEKPVYTYRVIEDLAELDTLSRSTPVMADIEVGGDINTDMPWETWLLSVAFNDGEQILVVPEELCKQAEEWGDDPWAVGGKSPLHDALNECITVWHNGKFDCRTLNARLGTNIYPHHDTMLMHYAQNHGAKEHGLKPLAQKYFNAPEWEKGLDQFTKGKAHYESIPREILYEYNAGDVYWTGELYRLFRERLENDPPRRTLYTNHLLPIVHMLQDLEGIAREKGGQGGVPVDVEFYQRRSEELAAEVEQYKDRLRELSDKPDFNSNSPKQVKEFFISQGHTLKDTSEPTLEVLSRELDKDSKEAQFIEALLEARGLDKLRSTYAEGILRRQRNGELYPQFLLHGTTTGRLSSKDPNIQNIPRPEEQDDPDTMRRGLVTAGPDFINVECDYSQAELRTLAELSNDEAMIAAFQPGGDDYFDAMMPAAYPKEFASLADYQQYKQDHPGEAKNKRAKLKGVQYGMNYGRGVNAIAVALNMNVSEAQALIDGIHATYPGLKVWQDNVRRAVTDPSLNHFLITPFNRVFQQEVVTDRNKSNVANQALAFVPQSTANDITLTAALEVHKRAKDYDFRITALIHDAIIGHGPKETAEAFSEMVRREMEGAAARVFHRVPFAAEATMGMNWAVL